jgi:hypothetical protein
MKKKILLSLAAVGTAVIMVPLFAAFEAHVINVLARIENALAVNTDPINFGTVFPQEELDRQFGVRLSQSFLEEERVDDVEYIIRQKPKCAWTTEDGQTLLSETQSGHVNDAGEITCPDPKPSTPPQQGAVYGHLPLLCPYLSKHELTDDGQETNNDGSLPAFHQIGQVVNGQWVWNDVKGRLAKSAPDIDDVWNLDLKVPCFGGFCAQDWADFVHGINPQANPDDFTQPIGNEHKIFGCDIWVEVTRVSEFGTPPPPEPGTITVTKFVNTVDGSSPTIQVSDFTLFVGAEQVVSEVGESFAPGTYSITESPAPNTNVNGTPFTTSFGGDADCVNGSVDLDPGENISCEITNTETESAGPTPPT